MFRILKFSFLYGVMLFSFTLVSAYELGHNEREVSWSDIVHGLSVLIYFLCAPTNLICFGSIVFGGLLFAYGKNAFSPWLGLISGSTNNDKLELARTVAILKTSQQLVLTTGLLLCFIGIGRTAFILSEGINIVTTSSVLALFCLADAGLIYLLLILPVRALAAA